MGLKSPLDGCWDGRGRIELWRALAQRRRRTPSSGRLWQSFDPWGSAPCRWDDGLGDQDATQGRLDDVWSMWQRARLVWHV
jgi:hypothetical protein